MGVTTRELLEFTRDVLDRERPTLADGGVILADDVRAGGLRLLRAAGRRTRAEEGRDGGDG